jgi:hypothetical protein
VPALSRRSFLAGGLAVGAAGFVLAACGSDDSSESSNLPDATSGAPNSGDPNRPDLVLVRFTVDGVLAAGIPQRIPVGLADPDGLLLVDTPPQLPPQVNSDSGPVGEPITVDRHAEGLARPYYPVITSLTEPGTYTLTGTVDGIDLETTFSVVEPGEVPIPQIGDPLVPVATPTTADAQGVDPICTREPTCDLHDVTLTSALSEGRPLAFLIATPAFCQTAACGPVLDVMLTLQSEFSDVRMVHAEVYTDTTLEATTAAVQDYKLSFEPVLYLAGADGVITSRLDSIYDVAELRGELTKLVG